MVNILDLIKVYKKDLGKSNKTSGNKFEITMSYMGAEIVFDYHDNYQNKSDKKDFLFALMSDSVAYRDTQNIESFIDYFDYNNENVKVVLRAYNECKEQFEKYNKLFTETEQQEIENLLADY